jgi:hypothetical protein
MLISQSYWRLWHSQERKMRDYGVRWIIPRYDINHPTLYVVLLTYAIYVCMTENTAEVL